MGRREGLRGTRSTTSAHDRGGGREGGRVPRSRGKGQKGAGAGASEGGRGGGSKKVAVAKKRQRPETIFSPPQERGMQELRVKAPQRGPATMRSTAGRPRSSRQRRAHHERRRLLARPKGDSQAANSNCRGGSFCGAGGVKVPRRQAREGAGRGEVHKAGKRPRMGSEAGSGRRRGSKTARRRPPRLYPTRWKKVGATTPLPTRGETSQNANLP